MVYVGIFSMKKPSGDWFFVGKKFHFFEDGSETSPCGCQRVHIKLGLEARKCSTCVGYARGEWERKPKKEVERKKDNFMDKELENTLLELALAKLREAAKDNVLKDVGIPHLENLIVFLDTVLDATSGNVTSEDIEWVKSFASKEKAYDLQNL